MRLFSFPKILLISSIFFMTLLFFYMVTLKDSKEKDYEYVVFNSKRYELKKPTGNILLNKLKKLKTNIKYILQWTSNQNSSLISLGEGRKGFISGKCAFTNCYITTNRSLLGDYTKFDVIAFSESEVRTINVNDLPQKRSPYQKYVFVGVESARTYPVCSNKFDGFFNWTWTYKLDSDARLGSIVVRDSEKKMIGPNKEMHWLQMEDMDPIRDNLKNQLRKKIKAAAWFVSKCRSTSNREGFIKALQRELKKYNLGVDVFGPCGTLKCPYNLEKECDKMLNDKYYFYLAFEDSFSDDYVTNTILHGLQHNAVPIVFGGANYTRFMPDGIYLNARELGVKRLAAKINESIHDFEKYTDFFRWKKYYSFHSTSESKDTNEYCKICSMLNNKELMQTKTIYYNFRKWWDPVNRC